MFNVTSIIQTKHLFQGQRLSSCLSCSPLFLLCFCSWPSTSNHILVLFLCFCYSISLLIPIKFLSFLSNALQFIVLLLKTVSLSCYPFLVTHMSFKIIIALLTCRKELALKKLVFFKTALFLLSKCTQTNKKKKAK